jgi:hypothetical protein
VKKICEKFADLRRLPPAFNGLRWPLTCHSINYRPQGFYQVGTLMVKSKVEPIKLKLQQLESGDVAKVSGFYISNHSACEAGDIWIRRQSQLPVCVSCGKSATFRLRREIEHISEDPDFK